MLEKVTDIKAIIGFGVMMTPALVVDGAVKFSGKVPSVEELKETAHRRNEMKPSLLKPVIVVALLAFVALSLALCRRAGSAPRAIRHRRRAARPAMPPSEPGWTR